MIAFSLVAAIIASVQGPIRAPVDSSAGIHGSAISSYNGLPLAGVMIFAPETQKLVMTDANGRFALGGLPVGRQPIQVSYDGRVTQAYIFELQPHSS